MKRVFVCLLLSLFLCSAAAAGEIRSIDINLLLYKDGSALVTEIWDVYADRGTEWYLVKNNLGDIEISDFRVWENGTEFANALKWDVDADLDKKRGKCGINVTSDGIELCWGLGSYGQHVFTASYNMSNVVKSLEDYDCFHMQLVSPGLSSPARKVRLHVAAQDCLLSAENSCMWGFGFEGECGFDDKGIFAESSSEFKKESSVILLTRFDKGLFESESSRDVLFGEVLLEAMEGSDFEEIKLEEDKEAVGLAFFSLVAIVLFIVLVFFAEGSRKKSIIGVRRIKDIDWCRDVPFGGNVLEANQVLWTVEPFRKSSCNVAGAMILRMIQNGALIVKAAKGDKIDICFNESYDLSGLDASEMELYSMMKEAAGSDEILQDKEFSRWSNRNVSRISKWVNSLTTTGNRALIDDGYMSKGLHYTQTGIREAAGVYGFKKFLDDFLLSDERRSAEVSVWRDYLVFACLFGIADKVARELKDINPEVAAQVMDMDPMLTYRLIWMTTRLSTGITNTAYRGASSSARGFGGATSFGGGGGFSGGGFGGGCR